MITKIEFDNLIQVINTFDKKDYYDQIEENINKVELESELTNIFKLSKYSILGIDIYKYSTYETLKQALIPFVFKIIRDETNKSIFKDNKYLFQFFNKITDFDKNFINTGDGGFFIFETPIHAIAYAIEFEKILRSFNSYHLYPKLREIVNSITVRYVITYDDLFEFESNFYGTAIINNARILNKDKLNRCLIDENTFNWFMKYFNGIESIRQININEISNKPPFINYNKSTLQNLSLDTYEKRFKSGIQVFGIDKCDILKIGTIESKGSKFSIYNLHLQYLYGLADEKDSKKVSNFTLSLGNLNTTGLNIL